MARTQRQALVEGTATRSQYRQPAGRGRHEAAAARQPPQAAGARRRSSRGCGTEQITNVRVVDRAVPPPEPYKPSFKKNLLLIAAFGRASWVGLAFLLSNLDRSLRSAEAGRAASAAARPRRDPGRRPPLRGRHGEGPCSGGARRLRPGRGGEVVDRAPAARRAAFAGRRGLPGVPRRAACFPGPAASSTVTVTSSFPGRGQDDDRRQPRASCWPSSGGASSSSMPTSTSRGSTRSFRSPIGPASSPCSPRTWSRRERS